MAVKPITTHLLEIYACTSLIVNVQPRPIILDVCYTDSL
ncbi:hypothetical protein PPTG_22195 [Phytophthora nicotianae INRA-310]|uniref:Uncharacterized protein n=2 Tax=Phytophthora nicotianae TaxID=4792 RepID=W2QLU6_PHYN3|nr:hypothetical protein PPTG_22195 [Phytophthora nicotianae INRA-310]ETN14113.1 hypothetical protein PPTG_22195 [Phytophthora nicotianae INRA-310]ETO82615.1 hypothetical protein F444_03266 [Phytophthora nicotianae P1976]